MKALSKLLVKYLVLNGTIYFRLFMPIIMLGLMGEITVFSLSNGNEFIQHQSASSMITAISVTQLIASGLIVLPTTIVDFKNSVLMKRIGATNVKPWQFLVVVIFLFMIESTFVFFYVKVVGTLIFGYRVHDWNIAFHSGLGIAYLWALFIMLLAVSLALLIVGFAKRPRQAQMIAQLLFFPISILSGGFVPVNILYSSKVLTSINYINPFRYALEPYLQSQGAFGKLEGHYSLNNEQLIYFPFIALGIAAIFFLIASRKLKWTS